MEKQLVQKSNIGLRKDIEYKDDALENKEGGAWPHGRHASKVKRYREIWSPYKMHWNHGSMHRLNC